ncbi:MAG: DUF4271 domain-containing protein [Flavobacteriales bacterium]
MSNNSLLAIAMELTKRSSSPALVFYLLLLVAIVVAVIKHTNTNFFSQLITIVSFDKNKFDLQGANFSFSKSSFFAQIAFIIVISLGISILTKEFLGGFQLIKNLSFTSGFCLVQIVGFKLFSSLLGHKEQSFFPARLAFYELLGFVLFPFVATTLYAPINLFYVFASLFLALHLLLLIRVSVYLAASVSVFHIILYLCTLEILPVLFLLKFIFN